MSYSNKFILTTKTLVVNSGIDFNLDVIFKFFECDNVICSIKYKNLLKTKVPITTDASPKTKEKISFFNQITFKFNSGTNMKIFKNSKIQITGVKTREDADEKLKYLLTKIQTIKGVLKINLKTTTDGIVYDDENNIISKYEYKISGKILKNKNDDNYKIIIGKNEECVLDKELPGLLISKDFKKCSKNIYLFNGDLIGYKKIIFNNKKYYLKRGSIVNENNEIIKYGEVIGRIETSFLRDCKLEVDKWFKTQTPDELNYISSSNWMSLSCLEYETKMTNYIYNTEKIIDRDGVYKKLSGENYNISFDPWMYKAINLKLFFNKETNAMSNICNLKHDSKVSLLIFRTGKIIVSSTVASKYEDKCLSIIEEFLEKYINIEEKLAL